MSRGFIFAVTGPDYTSLARQAAQTISQYHPDIAIDLFTDQDINDPVFSEIHRLDQSGRRPRFEALLRSRFDLTICLDADLFLVAPVDDIFEVLEHFDFAAAHDQRLNVASHTQKFHKTQIPAAFPQYNSGVIGMRRSDATLEFVRDWQHQFETSELTIDQPILRELLFLSDLRIATLPAQYNIIDVDLIRSWDSRTCAPRILHSSRIHMDATDTQPPIATAEDLVGRAYFKHLQEWQSVDGTLNPNGERYRTRAYCDSHPRKLIHRANTGLAGPQRISWLNRQLTRLGLFRSL